MNVTFRCPCCERTVKVQLAGGARSLVCSDCQAESTVSEEAVTDSDLRRCLVCPSRELFLRKDFPQRLGIALVLAGFAGFLIANYYYWPYVAFGILFATAAIDVVLYLVMGEALVCYRCGAHYRGVGNHGDFGSFELETHERYRQLAARLVETKHGSRTSTDPSVPTSTGKANSTAEP